MSQRGKKENGGSEAVQAFVQSGQLKLVTKQPPAAAHAEICGLQFDPGGNPPVHVYDTHEPLGIQQIRQFAILCYLYRLTRRRRRQRPRRIDYVNRHRRIGLVQIALIHRENRQRHEGRRIIRVALHAGHP